VILSLIPLVAAVERADREVWFAGFGSPRIVPQLAVEIRRIGVRIPLADVSAETGLPRSLLCDAARSLGLPEEWVRVRHRAPRDGAGINTFL
jgi:hypothetical protein